MPDYPFADFVHLSLRFQETRAGDKCPICQKKLKYSFNFHSLGIYIWCSGCSFRRYRTYTQCQINLSVIRFARSCCSGQRKVITLLDIE
jgi:hypothetical protein